MVAGRVALRCLSNLCPTLNERLDTKNIIISNGLPNLSNLSNLLEEL